MLKNRLGWEGRLVVLMDFLYARSRPSAVRRRRVRPRSPSTELRTGRFLLCICSDCNRAVLRVKYVSAYREATEAVRGEGCSVADPMNFLFLWRFSVSVLRCMGHAQASATTYSLTSPAQWHYEAGNFKIVPSYACTTIVESFAIFPQICAAIPAFLRMANDASASEGSTTIIIPLPMHQVL